MDADTTSHASPPAGVGPLTLHGLSVEGVNQCVHCGLCLAYCPTFSELGTEMDSPRGRIFLIKSLAEGRMSLSDSTVRHLSLCLDCRACETVCPAGVPYGRLIEAAKAEIERQQPGAPSRRLFRWLNFGLLLGHPRLLALAATAARLYQASGLQRLVRRTGLVRLLPGTLPAWEALLPPVPTRSERRPPPPVTSAEGPRRARVALLTGCVQSIIFGAHNRATARVLAKNGCDVIVPEGQGCCGALRGPLSPVALTCTYHDPCHVVHGQKIKSEPRQLLAQIPGLRVIELTESDWCCGSAGIYNLTQPEMATRLLHRKVSHVLATGAEAVVTANPGCILQIQAGLGVHAAPVRVMHLVEVLDRAYGGDPDGAR